MSTSYDTLREAVGSGLDGTERSSESSSEFVLGRGPRPGQPGASGGPHWPPFLPQIPVRGVYRKSHLRAKGTFGANQLGKQQDFGGYRPTRLYEIKNFLVALQVGSVVASSVVSENVRVL